MRLHAEAIGFYAGALTTIAFAPQVLRTWKTGGRDLSWLMLALFGLGVALWLVYGLLVQALPVVVANGLTGAQVLLIVVLKLRGPRDYVS